MTNKIMPKLRFKGFNKVWYPKDIAQLGTVITGNTPPKKDKSNYSSNGISWITPTDISNETINDTNEKLSIKGSRKSRLVPKNSILITCIGNSIGGKVLTSRTTGFNQQINALVPKNNDSYFLYSRFSLFGKIINMFSSQGTMPIIKKSAFAKITFYIPSLPEQQLIGKFFAKLDKLIQLQQKKVSLLKKLKRGYLQKLFRNRNENFISLDKLCDIKTGNKNANENIPNGKYPFFDRSTEVKHLNTYDYNEETIIYAGEGEQFLPRYFNGKYSLHQRAYSLYNFKKDIVNVIYLYEFLLTQSHRFIRYAVGSTVKSLRMDCFKHIYIPIIPLKKQNIVGEFLLQLSILIKLHSLKITYLRKLKKFYLQKMFC